jgi:hypothetical protein
VLSQDAGGAWGFWFGTQQRPYQLLHLPGEVRVCAGGDALNLRAAPSAGAAVTGTLPSGAIVTASRFVLEGTARPDP